MIINDKLPEEHSWTWLIANSMDRAMKKVVTIMTIDIHINMITSVSSSSSNMCTISNNMIVTNINKMIHDVMHCIVSMILIISILVRSRNTPADSYSW